MNSLISILYSGDLNTFPWRARPFRNIATSELLRCRQSEKRVND